MRLPIVVLAILLMTPSVAHVQVAQCVAADDVVCTQQGAVRGAIEGDLVAFRGIPYAQPPVGNLRWRPPQPATAWAGVRDATKYGPVCPQLSGREVVGDEDCLTLNISTRRTRTRDVLPVMVYLTGGGNHSQSGQGSGGVPFVGTRLVPEGVVLVTVNIRIGALGFLSIPALDAESEHHVSGNYGNQDHVAILKWVQQNIRAFGGDPQHVFLFGTSAGGANICGLLTSPLAQGMFHSAAMESSVPTGCTFQTKAQLQGRSGVRLTEATGCKGASDVAACLRAKSPRELVLAVPAVTDLFPRTYGPNVDGYVFPDQPIKLLAAGKALKIPLIIGTNLEETSGWVNSVGPVNDADGYRADVERIFGPELRDKVLAKYPIEQYTSPRQAFMRATTDALFTCASRRVERAIVQGGGGPVFRYLFNYRPENSGEGSVGHSSEMPFLFASWTNYKPGDRDRSISDSMVQFWTRMAKAGNPNAGKAIAWPAGNAQKSQFIELSVPPVTREGDAGAKCDFWDGEVLPSPHL